jgi:hypothetical protein
MSDWIKHDGLGCPVAYGTHVDVQYRTPRPTQYDSGLMAEEYDWEYAKFEQAGDIIAYRIVDDCPSCAQPADEPCPSSCGVEAISAASENLNRFFERSADVASAKGVEFRCSPAFRPLQSIPAEFTPSHPKAQELAVSDAAWGSLCAYEPIYRLSNPEKLEKQFAAASLVLRTREEWNALRGELTVWRDKYDRVIDQLTDMHQGDMEAELATLRAQLADKDSYIRMLRNVRRTMRLELERLRKGVSDGTSKQTGSNGDNGAGVGNVDRHNDRGGGLLVLNESDHRLGQGNRLEGEPEYHEPKPVIRTRPML